jgi:hypothetical protein
MTWLDLERKNYVNAAPRARREREIVTRAEAEGGFSDTLFSATNSGSKSRSD